MKPLELVARTFTSNPRRRGLVVVCRRWRRPRTMEDFMAAGTPRQREAHLYRRDRLDAARWIRWLLTGRALHRFTTDVLPEPDPDELLRLGRDPVDWYPL